MKKLSYILGVFLIGFYSCGGEQAGGEGEGDNQEAAVEGTVVDLTQYGMAYNITVPESNSSETEIMANDWGGIEIRKGQGFMISLNFGEGNLTQFKNDINGDLLYKATILDESDNHMLYKREIPDSGMNPEYHFIYVAKIGKDVVEIQNLKDEIFNEESARKMLSFAKSFSAKDGA